MCICYDPGVNLSISRNEQGNCPFHEMDSLTVHFVKWTNPYIFCYPFHEMDKVMYESLTFIHGQSFGLIYHFIPL